MAENKTELKFEVDKNKLEGVFVATLMSSLTKEDAEEMVHRALVQVLEHDYHTKQVLEEVAKEVIRQHLSDKDSPWRARMKELVEAAMERALASDALLTEWGGYGKNTDKVPTGQLVNRMAQALIGVLAK
jgi:hypothetical protein